MGLLDLRRTRREYFQWNLLSQLRPNAFFHLAGSSIDDFSPAYISLHCIGFF